jgi:6-phosphogluconolactonase
MLHEQFQDRILCMLWAIAFLAAAEPEPRLSLFAAMGRDLVQYDLDAASGGLNRGKSVACPANIQYVWQHPSRKFLYVAWSDGGPGSALGAPTGGANHGVTAFRLPDLIPHGQPAKLHSRPVHISVDGGGRYLLAAHTIPSELTVHKVHPDGTLGEQIAQREKPDAGVYAHQVREKGGNVVLTARGNLPSANKPEDPGVIRVFGLDRATGQLRTRASLTPQGGGFGFQPRHVDFHPTKPWMFVSVEGQNQLQVYRQFRGGPIYTIRTLDSTRTGQSAGAIHVHPNGRFVYVSNRYTTGPEGENGIAVFEVDQRTGEPKRVQNADSQGVSPRTFSLDPNGRVLLVGNQVPGKQPQVPANIAVFRVNAADGKLEFVRKYDLPELTNASSLFWIGVVELVP